MKRPRRRPYPPFLVLVVLLILQLVSVSPARAEEVTPTRPKDEEHAARETRKQPERLETASQQPQPKPRRRRREGWKLQRPSFEDLTKEFNNMTKAYQAFGLVFETDETPRDVLEGTWRALQSIGVGLGLGTVALLLFPAFLLAHAIANEDDEEHHEAVEEEATIAGVAANQLQDHWPTLLTGLAVGSLTGVAVNCLGLVHGSYQLLEGLKNTPAAIQQGWMDHQTWDPHSESWIPAYSIAYEQESLQAAYTTHYVADSTFYDLLSLPKTGASTRDIKDAYQKLALQYHPDQNRNNEPAAQKFTKLTTAYQTLVDPERRAHYDQHGYQEDDAFNFQVFFQILFGTPLVEPYVGTLTISTFVSQLVARVRSTSKTNGTTTLWSLDSILVWQDESTVAKRKRQVDIASHLVQRIESYNTTNTTQQFIDSVQREAQEVSTTAGFGDAFLLAIGEELQLQANYTLAPWWEWPYHATLLSYRHANLTVHSIYRTGQLVWNLTQQPQAQEGRDVLQDTKPSRLSADTIQKMLPNIMDIAWAHNRKDIASTMSGACQRVFRDASSPEERIRRAHALRALGEEFVRQGIESTPKRRQAKNPQEEQEEVCPEDLEAEMKARLEVAFQLAQTQQVSLLFPWIHLITCLVMLASGCQCLTNPQAFSCFLPGQKRGHAQQSDDMLQKAKLAAMSPMPTIRE